MKKVLLTGAALMLAGGMVSTASAAVEPGVKITGDARVRLFYNNDNYGDFGNTTTDEANTDMDSRIRVNIAGTAAGGAYAKARIRITDTSYAYDLDNDTGSIDNGVDHDNIWADIALVGIPFSDTFTLELGRYRSTYGPLAATYNFFYDDVNLAGARGIIKLGDVEINPFIEWMEEAQANDGYANESSDAAKDNDEIRFGAHVKAKLNKDWTIGGMLGYQVDSRDEVLDRFEANEGFFGSIYASGKSGAFGITGEIAVTDNNLNNFNSWERDDVSSSSTTGYELYDGPDADTDLDDIRAVTTTSYTDYIGSEDTGFGGYLFPNYQIDKLNIGLNIGMTTGGFQPDRAFGFVMVGSTDNSKISVARIGDTGDWMWFGLVANYQFNEALKLTGNIVYADVDPWDTKGINGDGPNTQSGALGYALDSAWELSAVLQYTISKGADVYFSAGYLKPEFEVSTLQDDAAFGALTRFELKF